MISKLLGSLRPLGALVVGALLATTAQAQAIHYVPGDYPTIGGAVNAAADGDRVVVSPGVYVEYEMEISGRDIVIESSAGAHATVITPYTWVTLGEADRLFSYDHGSRGVLRGFTLKGGRAKDGQHGGDLSYDGSPQYPPTDGTHGGAIEIVDGAPRIENCVFIDNEAGQGGSGMYGGGGSHGHSPGGIFCGTDGDDGEIAGELGANGGNGGAVYWSGFGPARPLLVNCLFVDNRAGQGGRGGQGENGGNGGLSDTLALCDGGDGGDGAPGGKGGVGGFGGAVYGRVDLVGCLFFNNQPGAAGEAGPGGDGGQGGWAYAPGFDNGEDGTAGPDGTPGSPGSRGAIVLEGPLGVLGFGGSLVSSVVWDNGPGHSFFGEGALVTSSLVQDAASAGVPLGASGNIDADPLFVGQLGGMPPLFPEGIFDVRFQPGSPCIDSGDLDGFVVTNDLDGNPRFVDDPLAANTGIGSVPYTDMGPYEYVPDPPTLGDNYVWMKPGGDDSGTVLSGSMLGHPLGTLAAAEAKISELLITVGLDPFYDIEDVGLMADSKTAAAGQPTVFTGQATTVDTPMRLLAVGGAVRLE